MSLWAPCITKQVVLSKGWLKYPFTVYSGNSTKIKYYELTYDYYNHHHCTIAHEQRL